MLRPTNILKSYAFSIAVSIIIINNWSPSGGKIVLILEIHFKHDFYQNNYTLNSPYSPFYWSWVNRLTEQVAPVIGFKVWQIKFFTFNFSAVLDTLSSNLLI